MFDVAALKDITVQSISFFAYGASSLYASIYTKSGSRVGSEEDQSSWNLITSSLYLSGESTFEYFNSGYTTIYRYTIPVSQFIQSSNTQAFYVTSSTNTYVT